MSDTRADHPRYEELDQEERANGKTRRVFRFLGKVLAVVIILGTVAVVAFILLHRRTDEISYSVPTSPTTGPPGTIDARAFAGRWVLAQGLDNPAGLEISYLPSGAYLFNSASAAADFEIAGNGTITGGDYDTLFVVDDPCIGGLHTSATGAEGEVDAAGIGEVTWHGQRDLEGVGTCQTETSPAVIRLQFWIQGEDMFLCRAVDPVARTCSATTPIQVARFHRQPPPITTSTSSP